ncbi:DUF732 domain-containing protein [Actinoplanes italicus]|uniref:DUF732 domain-containing protein n=1 Tax=Actinoplanes italicus TaxID=113567 RepID=UPI001474C2EC|nr:DUF732 domain-containing protein [Actinoplanes italicus]
MLAGRVLVAAGLVTFALAGCSDDSGEWVAPQPGASRTPGQEAAPLSDKQKAFLEQVTAADAKAGANESALDFGRGICLDTEQGKTDAQVTRNAANRFAVDTAIAKTIVKAARTNLCEK